MRPDAIPVRAVGSCAQLPPAVLRRVFGADATLRGPERVQVVRLGHVVAAVPVRAGADLALHLDALDLAALAAPEGVRLQGPVGAVAAPPPTAVQSRLVVPAGLRRAWNVGATATIGLGAVAASVPVVDGADGALEAERTLWTAAGQPETARWLPAVDLALPRVPEADDRVRVVERRVITETDVRQARLHRTRIRVTPGQVVTPAARSLAREWDVFQAEE